MMTINEIRDDIVREICVGLEVGLSIVPYVPEDTDPKYILKSASADGAIIGIEVIDFNEDGPRLVAYCYYHTDLPTISEADLKAMETAINDRPTYVDDPAGDMPF